jgi:hypothetical protein
MLAPCCAVYPSVRRTGTAQWRALQAGSGPARVASVREQQPHSEGLRARGEGPATRDSGRLGRWAGRLGQPPLFVHATDRTICALANGCGRVCTNDCAASQRAGRREWRRRFREAGERSRHRGCAGCQNLAAAGHVTAPFTGRDPAHRWGLRQGGQAGRSRPRRPHIGTWVRGLECHEQKAGSTRLTSASRASTTSSTPSLLARLGPSGCHPPCTDSLARMQRFLLVHLAPPNEGGWFAPPRPGRLLPARAAWRARVYRRALCRP